MAFASGSHSFHSKSGAITNHDSVTEVRLVSLLKGGQAVQQHSFHTHCLLTRLQGDLLIPSCNNLWS